MNDLNRLRQIVNAIDYQPMTEAFQFLHKRDSEITRDEILEVKESMPDFGIVNPIQNIKPNNFNINLKAKLPSLNRKSNLPKITKHGFNIRMKVHEMQKNIKSVTKLDVPNFVNTLDVHNPSIKPNKLNDIKKSNFNYIIQHHVPEVHTNTINNLNYNTFDEVLEVKNGIEVNNIDKVEKTSKDITVEYKIPNLRYKKVPSEPLEPVFHKFEINEVPFKLDDLVEPLPFNEDLPDYYSELLNMGYEQIDQLEGIPDLNACREFAEFYDEETNNLSGKAKGLFLLQTAKISEIALQLIMWDELDDYNEFLEGWLEEAGSEYQGATLTENGVQLNGKTFMNLRDKIMVKNNGRNTVRMGNDFRESLQDGNSVEKEIYDSFIDYLAQRNDDEEDNNNG